MWTDAYSDLPSIQDVLGSETRMTLVAASGKVDGPSLAAVVLTLRCVRAVTADRRSVSGSRRSVSHPSTNFLCATVDSVAVPDGWAVVRGFNFVVDVGTDMSGWQYANSFFDSEDRGTHSAGPPVDFSLSPHSLSGNSANSSKRSQSLWASQFDEDSQCVRRRLWCRVMCPAQYLQRALAACDRYLKKRERGDILVCNEMFVEIDGCCSSSYKLQRVILKDLSVEYYSGQKRVGSFPLSPRSRVRAQDSRIAEHKAHPLLLRVEDIGDQNRDADYIKLAMKSEIVRTMWFVTCYT